MRCDERVFCAGHRQIGWFIVVQLLDIRSRRDEPLPPPRTACEASGGAIGAWQIIATPSIFTRTWSAQPKEPLRAALLELKLMDADGDGLDYDQWDGYPAERAALTSAGVSLPPTAMSSSTS